jgi:hypothetical protein
MKKSSISRVRRVVMAKTVARQWLQDRASPEYRLTVYYGAKDIRGACNLVRSFRDDRVKMAGVEPLPDLGMAEAFDSFTVWTKNREALLTLNEWFEKRGYETSGVW